MNRVFLENEAINPLNPKEVGIEWLFVPEEHIYGFRFYKLESGEVRVEIVIMPPGMATSTLLVGKPFKSMKEAQKWVKETFPEVCSPLVKPERPRTIPEPTKNISTDM